MFRRSMICFYSSIAFSWREVWFFIMSSSRIGLMIQISEGGAAGMCVEVTFFLFEERRKRTRHDIRWCLCWFEWNKSKYKGLISADRRTKPTLMLTIPRSIFKSSTKDLSLPTFEIAMEYDARPKPIVMRVTSGEVNIVAFQHGFWLRGVQP